MSQPTLELSNIDSQIDEFLLSSSPPGEDLAKLADLLVQKSKTQSIPTQVSKNDDDQSKKKPRVVEGHRLPSGDNRTAHVMAITGKKAFATTSGGKKSVNQSNPKFLSHQNPSSSSTQEARIEQLEKNLKELSEENGELMKARDSDADVIERYKKNFHKRKTTVTKDDHLVDVIEEKIEETIKDAFAEHQQQHIFEIPKAQQEYLLSDLFIKSLLKELTAQDMCYRVVQNLWDRETRNVIRYNQPREKSKGFRFVDPKETQLITQVLDNAMNHPDIAPETVFNFGPKEVRSWVSNKLVKDRNKNKSREKRQSVDKVKKNE
ncbi:uncharacterized protein LOC107045630 [Diachasma alloeum]|uniref:uncharacterized protein LOC107045630 n=1 Tax=Diachasma alloeum TaxID=454923 RepID=UPI0007384F99|nr:uncharacterized protein LOC107045630 [Diachasma alloeum]